CQARAVDSIFLWQLETVFTWNVRTACSDREILERIGEAKYLLTTGTFEKLKLVSSFQNYNLYLMPSKPVHDSEATIAQLCDR
ncbi:MAG: hypothetical protein KJZ78_01040, partial [Bryobacteraceae bacterium]|nr:hypothetical protein [Bryobacteraceae bacterium]